MDARNISYEYDEERQVLLKFVKGKVPQIMRRNELVFRNLDSRDDMYARAIYIGQGCWERLETITETEAHSILSEWGYKE